MNVFDIALLSIKATKPPKLLDTCVLYTEMTSLLAVWHRNGFIGEAPTDRLSGFLACLFRLMRTDSTVIKEELRQITRELAQKMVTSHLTVIRHLHSVDKVQKHEECVRHAFTERNKLWCSSTDTSLLARQQATRGYKERARLETSATPTIFF